MTLVTFVFKVISMSTTKAQLLIKMRYRNTEYMQQIKSIT